MRAAEGDGETWSFLISWSGLQGDINCLMSGSDLLGKIFITKKTKLILVFVLCVCVF